MPKCFLCLAGYVIVFTGTGATVKELCGDTPPSSWVLVLIGVAAAWLAWTAFRVLPRFFRPGESGVRKGVARSLKH